MFPKECSILQEYMWHRKWTYMRLDGSSKISDRRDMVADFQTRFCLFFILFFFFFQGTPIEWKKGKNVTVKTIKKKQKHKSKGSVRTVSKTVQNDSFFNFFSPPSGMLFNLNIVGSVCSYELL